MFDSLVRIMPSAVFITSTIALCSLMHRLLHPSCSGIIIKCSFKNILVTRSKLAFMRSLLKC